MFRHLRRVVLVLAVLLAAPAASDAAATDASTSDNWSGYAVHGATFREVSGTWREPSGSCTAGDATDASFWVGLGGYSGRSNALEQIGTELDCTTRGTLRASAWYELVPAASRRVSITVAPGDLIRGSVRVVGDRVTLRLSDLTRHESFVRTAVDSDLDLRSAEWIAEAPSDCSGDRCSVLSLTDFGSAAFTSARARTSAGALVLPGSSSVATTAITLRGTDATSDTATAVTATPSALAAGTGAFSVTYASATSTTSSGGPGAPPSATPQVVSKSDSVASWSAPPTGYIVAIQWWKLSPRSTSSA